jgi:hypothetical protein
MADTTEIDFDVAILERELAKGHLPARVAQERGWTKDKLLGRVERLRSKWYDALALNKDPRDVLAQYLAKVDGQVDKAAAVQAIFESGAPRERITTVKKRAKDPSDGQEVYTEVREVEAARGGVTVGDYLRTIEQITSLEKDKIAVAQDLGITPREVAAAPPTIQVTLTQMVLQAGMAGDIEMLKRIAAGDRTVLPSSSLPAPIDAQVVDVSNTTPEQPANMPEIPYTEEVFDKLRALPDKAPDEVCEEDEDL